jgi:hypothetical protein
MDLMRARVALRERPLLDTLDLAVRFCAAHAGAYVRLSAVVLVPALALSWCAARLAGWWVGWTVTWAVTAFAGAPFVALASRLVFADTVRTREVLGVAIRAIPRLIVVRLVQTGALTLSALLLGFPWLWLGTVFLFVVEVLVLEQSGVSASLERARRVASAHFPDAVLTMLLLVVAPVAAAMLGDVAGREILETLLQLKAPPPLFRAGGSWLALMGWWAAVPLLETARFFVYLDIRTRTEGWDIQTRFAAIAARSEAERAAPDSLGTERAGRRRVVVGGLALLALLAVGRPAHAAFDPAHAQTDVDAAMHEGDYPFCRAPRTPLSPAARDLCPHAAAIPACGGFVAGCVAATAPPPSPWSWPWGEHALSVPAFVGMAARIVVWLLVAALVMAVLVPVLRAVARVGRGSGPREGVQRRDAARVDEALALPPASTDEELLLSRGDELARAGRFGAALQHYLAASLRALDRRGSLRMTPDRTNGEYVRGCTEADARAALREIVGEVDRVQFGGEEATLDGVARASRRALAIVRVLPVLGLMLALAWLPGCGSGIGARGTAPRDGDDPAGAELFRDVLRRQGVEVEPLATSLASLELPQPGERAPAVVVDLERTDLDEDTREHLVEWVRAGGVLVLAGHAGDWPKVFGATATLAAGPHQIAVHRLRTRNADSDSDGDDDDAPEKSPLPAQTLERGILASPTGLRFDVPAESVASFEDGTTYAARVTHGAGAVLGIASDELMTNAGLARPGNAAAMVSLLSNADRLELRLAAAEDGVSPPSTPIAVLLRAGLGTGLAHALLAVLVLFLAFGARLGRPRPVPAPRRRAFAEHVEAVGALYARTRSAPHALAAYARFADERLRARMPRGSGDVPGFLASRAQLPLDGCQRLWSRAVEATAGEPPRGDELAVLWELSAVCSAAMDQGPDSLPTSRLPLFL